MIYKFSIKEDVFCAKDLSSCVRTVTGVITGVVTGVVIFPSTRVFTSTYPNIILNGLGNLTHLVAALQYFPATLGFLNAKCEHAIVSVLDVLGSDVPHVRYGNINGLTVALELEPPSIVLIAAADDALKLEVLVVIQEVLHQEALDGLEVRPVFFQPLTDLFLSIAIDAD
jgi:hypothetical protein